MLLTDIALVRFHEARRFAGDELYELNRLYMPLDISENFPLARIHAGFNRPVDRMIFNYSLHNTDLPHRISRHGISFTWYRDRPAGEATFHRQRVEFNAAPWWRYHGTRHGYEFVAYMPAELTEKDAYDLINAITNPQPLTTWEFQGNAVSVSIQGMENVTIFDEDGYEIVSITTPRSSFFTILWSTDHRLEHHSLYISNGESLSRVGYSWLIDADSSRRQYVLKSGTYTFHVEDVIGNPDLLIRHFAEREIVSSASYRRELRRQSLSSFTVTVTPDTSGNGDVVVID